jgi:hypothetical protein
MANALLPSTGLVFPYKKIDENSLLDKLNIQKKEQYVKKK